MLALVRSASTAHEAGPELYSFRHFCPVSSFLASRTRYYSNNAFSLYYHVFILLLFRRFTKLRILGSQTSARDVCAQSARTILALVDSYANLYTLRRAPAFLPYFLFAAAWVYFDSCQDPSGTSTEPTEQDVEMMRQSIEGLEKMAPFHTIAKHAMATLQDLSVEKNMSLGHDGIRAPFQGNSPARERKEVVFSSRRHGKNVARGMPYRTEDVYVLGLVWLQDDMSFGSRAQMEQAGFTMI